MPSVLSKKSPVFRSIVAHRENYHPPLNPRRHLSGYPKLLNLIPLVLCISLAPLCVGAISFDAANSAAGTSSQMSPYKHTISKGSNCVLFAGVKVATPADIIGGVNYGSTPMTRLDYYRNSASGVYLYFQAAPCSSANNIGIVFAANTPANIMTTLASVSYHGVASAQPANMIDGGMATPAFKASLSQTAAGSWLMAFVDNKSAFQPGTGSIFRAGGRTNISEILDNQGLGLPAASATLAASQLGGASAAWLYIAAELIPAAAAPVTAPPLTAPPVTPTTAPVTPPVTPPASAAAPVPSQSLRLTPGFTASVANPNLSPAQAWRVEFQLHDWDTNYPVDPGNEAGVFGMNGTGVVASLLKGNILRAFDNRDQNGGTICDLSLANRTNVLVRLQRLTSPQQFVCELWNYDGSGYESATVPYTAPLSWPYSGGSFGSAWTTAQLGFFRILDWTVALAGQPPITAVTGDLLDLKFDGNGTDTSGNGYLVTSSSPISFGATPNLGAFAIAKTSAAPRWANWVSLRAGFPATLDGGSSFSLSGVSSTLTYNWSQLTGMGDPSTVVWSGQNTATPTIRGLLFGTYHFQLTVKDASGTTGTTTLAVGAVATDSNGVVVQANPAADLIFGPMIAFGKHAWSYVDYSQKALFDYWSQQYQYKGGPWYLESDQTSVDGIPRTGTASVVRGENVVTGVGTNFRAVFCPGNTPAPGGGWLADASAGGAYFVLHIPGATAGSPYFAYSRLVGSCQSDTQITFAAGYYWETQDTANGLPWGTYNICKSCGNWAAANNTTSNINYYDNAAAHYSLWLRSGLDDARQAGEWMADRWIHGPYVAFTAQRDLDLVGEMLRASMDSNGAADLWPSIRYWINSGCSSSSHIIGDVREDSYCLVYHAAQAILDTGSNQTQALQWLQDAYTGVWNVPASQQWTGSDLTYINYEFEGDGSRTLVAEKGSNTMTLTPATAASAPLSSKFCGDDQVVTSAGTLSLSTRLVVNGVGTAFTKASAGQVIQITGTRNGVPWAQTSQIARVDSDTALELVNEWRGDMPVVVSNWRILAGPINNTGFYNQFFAGTDSTGVVLPDQIDSDNWYWCTMSSPSTITLDKPYTGNTDASNGGTPWRRITAMDNTGRGTQPFMLGITAWGLNLASSALAPTNAAVAAQYKTLARSVAGFLSNEAFDPVMQGTYYAYSNFSDCVGIQETADDPHNVLSCSAGTTATARDYTVEAMSAMSQSYLSGGTPADRDTVDARETTLYASPGFSSPTPGDGNSVDMLNCCDQFTLTKYYGQAYTVGQAYQWPAARVGGVAAAQWTSVPVPFTLGSASSVRITVTQPSGSTQGPHGAVFSCTTSPCSVWVDQRQGDHWLKMDYLSAAGSLLSTSTALQQLN